MFTKEQELVDLALEDEDWDDGAVGRLVKLIGLQVGGGQSYVVKLAKCVTKKTPTLVNSPEFVAALGTLKPKHAWKILTTLKDEPRTQFATACCSWVDNGDWRPASAGQRSAQLVVLHWWSWFCAFGMLDDSGIYLVSGTAGQSRRRV